MPKRLFLTFFLVVAHVPLHMVYKVVNEIFDLSNEVTHRSTIVFVSG